MTDGVTPDENLRLCAVNVRTRDVFIANSGSFVMTKPFTLGVQLAKTEALVVGVCDSVYCQGAI